MAESQMAGGAEEDMRKLPADQKKPYEELRKQRAAAGPRPAPPGPTAMAVSDIGHGVPPTHRLAGGDWRKPREEVQPGFLEVLRTAVADVRPTPISDSSGRRAAL